MKRDLKKEVLREKGCRWVRAKRTVDKTDHQNRGGGGGIESREKTISWLVKEKGGEDAEEQRS